MTNRLDKYDGDRDGIIDAGAIDVHDRYTDEEVEDVVDALLAAGSNVTLTYDDANNTLTIDASGTDTHTDVSEGGTTLVADVGDINVTGSGVDATDDGDGTVTLTITDTDTDTQRTDEEIQDVVDALLLGGSNVTLTYDDANNSLTIDATDTTRSDEEIRDTAGAMAADGLAHDDAADTLGMNVVASGQVTLSSGSAVVDTGVSAVDATFQLAIGVDDPGADTKIVGRLFWDDSVGTYHAELVEDGTAVGNPTVNYDIIRVR